MQMKRAFRWTVEATPADAVADGIIQNWSLKKCDKPGLSVSEVEHKYMNHTFYYPGRVTWNEITMTLADVYTDSESSTGLKVLNTIAGGGYGIPDSDAATFICKQNMVYTNFTIKQFACNTGEVVETFELQNAWIKDLKLGTLDYASEDPIDVELTIKYDWCTILGGVGGDPANGALFALGAS
jgi:hypothetical protein